MFPLPPTSETGFLNTGPDAHYIGVSACAGCHPDKHQSYLLTAHSQALADLDPSAEPPDGAFEHRPSGRSYRVYRQDGQLRHEEVLRTPDGKEMARIDLPMRYRIGSGSFTRTYLVEIDGFLHQSPITWYAQKNKWAMSPGYDQEQHPGFERSAGVVCLVCHSGRAEAVGASFHRIFLHEKAIGCESCHGPGSLHQEWQRRKKHVAGTKDPTIVHPDRLSRSLQEAICAVCHPSGSATVRVRGRGLTDFRPGMPLTDYRTDYSLDTGSAQMTVVGHMEQLQRSACYQKRADLTCFTCHDPHLRHKPKDPSAFYRQKCLNCHTAEACGLGQAQQLKQDATDNCVACHMPRGDTELPHIAFTHHRIGRHGQPPPAGGPVPELVPCGDVSHLPPLDRQRNLGMAYLLAAQNPANAEHSVIFWQRARDLLEAVHAAGLRDAEMAAALVEIWRDADRARARVYAREVVEAKDAPAEARVRALYFLGVWANQDRKFKDAVAPLEEAVLLRRYAEDWRICSACRTWSRTSRSRRSTRCSRPWPFAPIARAAMRRSRSCIARWATASTPTSTWRRRAGSNNVARTDAKREKDFRSLRDFGSLTLAVPMLRRAMDYNRMGRERIISRTRGIKP